MCLVVGLLNESKKDSIIIQYGNHAVLSCFHFVDDLSVFIAISTAGLQSDSLSDLYVLRKLELNTVSYSMIFFFICKQSWSDDTHLISIGDLFSEFSVSVISKQLG